MITNAYKFHVRMTEDGFRVMGANKMVFVKSFDDVLAHIKSHGWWLRDQWGWSFNFIL